MKLIKKLRFLLVLAVVFTANVSAREYVTYYFNDAQGSPIAATNEIGTVIWKKEHTPYGKTHGNTDDKSNRIGFTGHVEEESFNLVYMQQRWYDPMIGRFYSVDPVGFSESNPMSFNRYAYANNNPYKFVDPDGKEAVLGAIGLAVGGIAGGYQSFAAGEDRDQIKNAALIGAAVGGIIGLTNGAGTALAVEVGADMAGSIVAGAATKVLDPVQNKNPGDLLGIADDGANGALGNLAGQLASEGTKKAAVVSAAISALGGAVYDQVENEESGKNKGSK